MLTRALADCYTRAGWDLVTGTFRRRTKPKLRVDEPDREARPRYPTLRELQTTARRVVDEIGYGREVAADVRGFVDARMSSLRQGTPGRFFEGGHPLDIPALLKRCAVLELETITSDQDKAFLMGSVLIRVVEHLRMGRPADGQHGGLRHVLLIEEAHRLLKNVKTGPAAAAVELFASLLAEIRAYGEGVVVVEQIPSKIIPDVVKNTAFKVMHRLPAKDDRDAVGDTMNLQDGSQESVVALRPGFAAVAVDGWDRPLLARVAGGSAREDSAGCRTYPPISGRRSVACPGACQERACALGEIADGAAAAESPEATIWAECVTAAVLMGMAPPRPRARIIDGWPTEPRLRGCAVVTAVERAVDARRAHLAPWVDADDLALRLHAARVSQLRGGCGAGQGVVVQ